MALNWAFGRTIPLRRLVWAGENEFHLESGLATPIPSKDSFLLRVRAVGICGTDIHILRGELPGVRPPRVLGHEIAGEVHAIGEGITRFKVGDRVTVDSVVGCGNCGFCSRGRQQFCRSGYEFGVSHDGGCQDFLLVPEANAFHISPNISFEEGAILDMEVFSALKRCGVREGDVALVAGDGPAGLIACQLLRHMGASKVLLSGQSPGRMRTAGRLELADRVIDSRCNSVPSIVASETAGIGVDISVDCAGTEDSANDAIRSVAAGGSVLLYGVYSKPLVHFDLNQIVLRDLKVFGALSDRLGWESVIDLVESRKLELSSLITHRFPLEEAQLAFESVQARTDGLVKAVFLL
ncbi:MAG: alcohol dehydrogenase catalytic domain-containing protein [Bryobacteraceae bacterium]